MKKIIIAIVSVFIILCVPIIGLPLYSASVPDVYGQTYLAAMADKFSRLHKLEEEKIVLVGGSSMAFGIDSTAIERELKMQIVNMGLYAALGSKTTLDLTLSGIKNGDIVVFAPEMDKQAYSMYTNPEIIVQTLEADRSMIWQIPLGEWSGLFNQLPSYVKEKKELLNNIPAPVNAYSRQAFNEYGDNVYDRPYNVMPELYLSANMIDITEELLDEDFIDYVNKYAETVRGKGAQFYFSFPPMNRLALTPNSTYQKRLSVYEQLNRLLDCEIIGNIEDHIINEGYFYDSNYHLNNHGVDYNTKELIGDLKRQLGDDSRTDISVLPPLGTEGSQNGDLTDDKYSEDFEYIEDAAGWAIVGVNSSALGKDILRVPRSYQGKSVYKIKQGAFKNCSAVSINIGENITVLEDGIFAGCPNLSSVNLSVKLGAKDALPTVGGNLFDGANQNIKLYVPSIKYASMVTDYFWMMYRSFIVIAE